MNCCTMPGLRVFRCSLALVIILLSAGCASFTHDCEKAAQQIAPPTDLQGRWQGVWMSDVTHHTDPLRCVVTRQADGTYRARFHAKYHQVLSFGYTVPLKVEAATNRFNFSGEADLGWLAGGVYQYAGHADTAHFFSTYTCKYDHGTFQMTRP